MSRTYVIYYGWLTADQLGAPNQVARAIAAAKVPLLVAHYWTAPPERHKNLSSPVLSLLQGAGTEVFAYVATNWGNAESGAVESAVSEYLEAGVDGIFFDESDALVSEARLQYYERLARLIRDQGGKIILNPGVSRCGERIMRVADRIMLEHDWRDFSVQSPWMRRYAPARFMGVSSNEGNALGYLVDEQRALADTREAWQCGIGWHTSTNRYIELPEWFGSYVQGVSATV